MSGLEGPVVVSLSPDEGSTQGEDRDRQDGDFLLLSSQSPGSTPTDEREGEKEVDPDEYEEKGYKFSSEVNPFFMSVVKGEHDIVQQRLQEDPEALTMTDGYHSGFNILQLSVTCGYASLVTQVLSLAIARRCITPLLTTLDSNLRTVLHTAAVSGDLPIVRALVMVGGCELDVVDKSQRTPLFVAASHQHHELAKMLLQLGANPFIKDSFGRLPMELADHKGQAIFKSYGGGEYCKMSSLSKARVIQTANRCLASPPSSSSGGGVTIPMDSTIKTLFRQRLEDKKALPEVVFSKHEVTGTFNLGKMDRPLPNSRRSRGSSRPTRPQVRCLRPSLSTATTTTTTSTGKDVVGGVGQAQADKKSREGQVTRPRHEEEEILRSTVSYVIDDLPADLFRELEEYMLVVPRCSGDLTEIKV